MVYSHYVTLYVASGTKPLANKDVSYLAFQYHTPHLQPNQTKPNKTNKKPQKQGLGYKELIIAATPRKHQLQNGESRTEKWGKRRCNNHCVQLMLNVAGD